jgi:aminoglycoside 3-N-acetyltransferase
LEIATVTNEPAVSRLSEEWRKSGVESSDILLLHSSTKRTLRKLHKWGFTPDIRTILDSFLDVLGAAGTLLLPLFNFDFASGVPFDIRSTPSQMGALTEAGRTHPEAVRTGHPIYSFAVLGNGRERFRGLKNFSGYGADSPFAILHKAGGKIAVLDLPDQHSMTFYHYVEESMSVDYRFHKQFSGLYTDFDGVACKRTYGLFVRKTDQGVVTQVDPMAEILWEKGLYSGDRPGNGSGLRVIEASKLYDEVAAVIAQGKARGLLYEIQ